MNGRTPAPATPAGELVPRDDTSERVPELLPMKRHEWVPRASIAGRWQRDAFLGRHASVFRNRSDQAVLGEDFGTPDVYGGSVVLAAIVRLKLDVSNLDHRSGHSDLCWAGVVRSPLNVTVGRHQ